MGGESRRKSPGMPIGTTYLPTTAREDTPMRISPVSPVYPVQPTPAPVHRCQDMSQCKMTARQCARTHQVNDIWSDPRVNGESSATIRATR